MQAAVLVRHGSPRGAFEIQELQDPRPGPGEIAIDVEAFGLNFADVMARLGLYRDAPPLPCVLGYEVVGRVRSVGAGAAGFALGQRVVAFSRFGGYATVVVTSASGAAPVPQGMDAVSALGIPTQLGTAWFCAEEMVRLHAGDHVLVQAAAGGVGTALVQLARLRGCVVYGTAGSDQKLELLSRLGVRHPINYRREDFAEVVRRIRGDDGLDVVFDSIGGASVKKGLSLLGSGGRMVCFGAASQSGPRRSVWRSLRMVAGFGFVHPIGLMLGSRAVIGVNMLRIADHRPSVLARVLRSAVDAVESGAVEIVSGGMFPAAEIAEAHELLGSRASVGKVAVRW